MKEPSPKSEEDKESIAKEMGSSGREPKLEEEVELVAPLVEKKRRIETWALDKKKLASAFKIPVPLK